MTGKRSTSSGFSRCGRPTKDVRPEPAEGLLSHLPSSSPGPSSSPDFPRCTFSFADGRRCALPAHPQGDGLCYPHAHAPHRRLRPSDLTRELASPAGTPIPAEKIHRVLAKLPIAFADGTISLDQFRAMNNLCYVMLQCSRVSATELPAYPHDHDWNVVTAPLNEDPSEDPNEKHDELSLLPANR